MSLSLTRVVLSQLVSQYNCAHSMTIGGYRGLHPILAASTIPADANFVCFNSGQYSMFCHTT